nr:uncharacterized protein LOC120963370 [Aegilops tauschii subsp. strangulata]
MPTTDNETANFFIIKNIIFEGGVGVAAFVGGVGAAAFDPDETQSQDDQAPFMADTFDQGHGGISDPFMQDQDGMGSTFPLDHELPKDYNIKEEDEVDIDMEPLFEDKLSTHVGANKKHKSKRMKAYTQPEDKLLCEYWRDIGQDPKDGAEQKFAPYQMESKCGWVSLSKRWKVIQQECNKFCPMSGLNMKAMAFQALEAFKAQHDDKSFNLTRCWMVINRDKKFKAQYSAIKARGGEEVVEDHGEGEKPHLRGKTNSKKEDKRDAASIALHATLEGMMTKKDTREEKRRQDKEEKMTAFMEIQRRRLELDVEKQAKKLEMEAEKQRKTLEIEATNAKTKAKEVALTCRTMGWIS